MSIDVHAHLYPPAYSGFLSRGAEQSQRLAGRLEAMNRRDPHFGGALDERLELMSEVGIERQVLSMPNQWVLVEEAGACAANAAASNDALAEVCRQHPRRFSLFASLPLVDPEAALRELERATRDLGALGIIMPTHVLGRPLDWEGLEPLYARLEQEQLPLFLHPGPPSHAIAPEGYEDYGLSSTLYYPVEDANALLRMVCSGVLERHPDLRVICPHLGGAIPYLFRRIDLHTHRRMRDGNPLPQPPSYYLKKVLYDTVSEHGPALACACNTVGVQQIVLGTDFPYVDGPGVWAIMATIDQLQATDAERKGILEENARAWLRL